MARTSAPNRPTSRRFPAERIRDLRRTRHVARLQAFHETDGTRSRDPVSAQGTRPALFCVSATIPLYAGAALALSQSVLVKKTIESEEIANAVQNVAEAIAAAHPNADNLVLAGIANGGIPFCSLLEAELAKRLGTSIPKAVIDISFHRDDIGQKPITKEVQSTQMATDPEDSIIILVDDVLFSGRTIRAAIAEVLTLGRPYKIELAVLVDRQNRRLPIAADYTGLVVETTPEQLVKVHFEVNNPDQNRIEILEPKSK